MATDLIIYTFEEAGEKRIGIATDDDRVLISMRQSDWSRITSRPKTNPRRLLKEAFKRVFIDINHEDEGPGAA